MAVGGGLDWRRAAKGATSPVMIVKGEEDGSVGATLAQALCEAAASGNLWAMELLLLRAHVPAWRPSRGMSPLEVAALNDQVDATRMLLKHGAARDGKGLRAARTISSRRISQLASAACLDTGSRPALQSQAGALHRQRQVAKLLAPAEWSYSRKCSVQ